MYSSIRWKQRFQNFEKSYRVLQEIIKIQNKSVAEKMGMIQAFEVLFELSWKLMKDYLEELGYQPRGPRDIIKQSLQDGIIQDGHIWLQALQNRNETSHLYDEMISQKIEQNITKDYAVIFHNLYMYFKKKIDD